MNNCMRRTDYMNTSGYATDSLGGSSVIGQLIGTKNLGISSTDPTYIGGFQGAPGFATNREQQSFL